MRRVHHSFPNLLNRLARLLLAVLLAQSLVLFQLGHVLAAPAGVASGAGGMAQPCHETPAAAVAHAAPEAAHGKSHPAASRPSCGTLCPVNVLPVETAAAAPAPRAARPPIAAARPLSPPWPPGLERPPKDRA